MRKATVHQFTHRALLAFRPTVALVEQALGRFRRYLLTLPAVSETMQKHVDDMRKSSSILRANIEHFGVSRQNFLSAQFVVELDDLD